jgi:hypothetical protein
MGGQWRHAVQGWTSLLERARSIDDGACAAHFVYRFLIFRWYCRVAANWRSPPPRSQVDASINSNSLLQPPAPIRTHLTNTSCNIKNCEHANSSTIILIKTTFCLIKFCPVRLSYVLAVEVMNETQITHKYFDPCRRRGGPSTRRRNAADCTR